MFIAYHTRNFDDTAARIKKLVAVLDKSWFQAKKKEFAELCSDGEDCYAIDYTPDNYDEYLQSLDPEERRGSGNNFTQAVFFDQFCFYVGYSNNKVCGESVADKIVATTKQIISEAGDDKDYPAFKSWVDDIKLWIDEEVNENIDYIKDEKYTAIMQGIVHKIKWKIDHRLNDLLKVLERKYTRNTAAVPTDTIGDTAVNATQNNFSTKYETDSLKEIFFSKAVEQYADIEKRLLIDKFIDENCLWLRQKQELVALIHILNNRKYLRPIPGKSKGNNYKYYKYFFEHRYSKNITEQSKPSKFPINKLSNYEPTFHFIPNIG